MPAALDNLIRQWTRLGAGFNAAPAPATPDLERLLLHTARCASRDARLCIMAATWLARYGDLIARHRLLHLIRTELEPAHQPALGLLLDIAQQTTHPPRFATILRQLHPASPARPLFDNQQAPALRRLAARRASDLSRKWGLWTQPFDLKPDALRPPAHVMATDPLLTIRADFRGDLRSSILAALAHDPDAGAGISRLSRAAGGSYAETHRALANLELTGKVSITRQTPPHPATIRLTMLRAS